MWLEIVYKLYHNIDCSIDSRKVIIKIIYLHTYKNTYKYINLLFQILLQSKYILKIW